MPAASLTRSAAQPDSRAAQSDFGCATGSDTPTNRHRARIVVLGGKTYTQEELDHARTAVAKQVAAYKKFVKPLTALRRTRSRPLSRPWNRTTSTNMILVLDRYLPISTSAILSGSAGRSPNRSQSVLREHRAQVRRTFPRAVDARRLDCTTYNRTPSRQAILDKPHDTPGAWGRGQIAFGLASDS